VNGRRAAAAVVGSGILASQAGHLVTYQLRFGSAAEQLQSSGIHSYFPALARYGLGALAVVLLAGLFMVGLARVMGGRRIEAESAPSYLRLLAVVYTVQLAIFAGQETLEASLSGVPAGSAADLILWGTVGQLPIAAVAALALRWLLARIGPAAEQVGLLFSPAVAPLQLAPVLISAPVAPRPSTVRRSLWASSLRRRGPPSF
jgi:hypothetical protein